MTTTDSKTVAHLDGADFVFCATKDDDSTQVGVLNVTSTEPENPQDASSLNSIKYIPKGQGKQTLVGGGAKKSSQTQPSSSSRNYPPPPPISKNVKADGTIKSTKSSGSSSQDSTRRRH